MKTIISSVSEFKNIILEILFSKTDKLSKVSNTSALNALAYGNAKIAQKAVKDIAIVESQLFPEYATGEYLDDVAQRYGIFERLGSIGSSTYLYLFGDSGTTYYKNTSKFISSDGITFTLDLSSITIPDCKYIYAKISSEDSGTNTNVEPLSIVTCTNPPKGHIFCINEFMATGGRNEESDEELLYRIQNIHNVLATKTLEYLHQIALRFNPNILKFVHLGTHLGKTKLGVYTQNGAALTNNELASLTVQLQEYLSIGDISESINTRVYLENINYSPIDLNFKLEFQSNLYSINEIYSSIQRKLISFVDFRFWDINQKVQWTDLYNIVKNTEGVISVPYVDFKVNGAQNDIEVNKTLLPKFRSCLIYDISGTSILSIDMAENMFPVIYPVSKNEMFDSYF